MAKSHKASFQYESSGLAHVGTLEVHGSGADTVLEVKTKFGSAESELGNPYAGPEHTTAYLA